MNDMTLVKEESFGEATLNCPLCDFVSTGTYDQDDDMRFSRSEDDAARWVSQVLGEHVFIDHKDRVTYTRKTRRLYKSEAPA